MNCTNDKSVKKILIFAIGFVLLVLAGCTEISSDANSSTSSASNGGSSSGSSSSFPIPGSSSSSGTTSGGSTSSSSTSTASGTQSATYSTSSSPNVIEVSSDTSELTISGLTSGQRIYLAKTNPTSSTISASYSRYITDATGMSLNTASSSSSSSGSSSTPSTPGGTMPGHTPTRDMDSDEASMLRWHCFIPGDFELESVVESARAATSSVTQIDGVVGDTKSIYVDVDEDVSQFEAKNSTLRAVGTYCYVWIVDEFYSETASGNAVDTTVAEKIATQFDAIYPMVRNVLGEESDYLLSSSGSASYAMSSYSATGDKVNIVLYDIANDYSESATSTTGIAGYFYSRDYYYSGSSTSNKGKYFYVDSAYANEDINDIYSTLAHEFQHMIHFGVKKINQSLSSGTGYNEMLSMLCEDMMEAYFEGALDGFDVEASPICRLPWFNALYYYSGLEYRSTSTAYALCSYATNYAFGAWLLRNYGGIPLLAEMSSNSYVDTYSIVAAVNSINGTSLTIADLLAAFAQACIIEGEDSGFNISVDELSSGSDYYYSASAGSVTYGYPLTAIDLWDLETLLPNYYASTSSSSYSSYYKYDGPDLLCSNEYAEVRPYGIMLHDLGSATASSVTLDFSTKTNSSLKMYIIIE